MNKKIIMTLVCLMTITMNANAQNMTLLKQGAVNFIRESCKIFLINKFLAKKKLERLPF